MTSRPSDTSSPTSRHGVPIRHRLRLVQWAALADLLLLIALVSSAVTGQRDLVHILGPIHGLNYLLLLALVGTAALDGLWGWWFPLLVLVTAGPPGAFLGEWYVKRQLAHVITDAGTASDEIHVPVSTGAHQSQRETGEVAR